MSLSLAQSSRKSRIGSDPRNTQWANDMSQFGHQQLLNMGWKPGRGLGYSVEGVKEHVKVNYKRDSRGLGYELAQADQPTGLDVFQKILGKLNGNAEEVEEKQQKQQSLSGLYMHFVPGGVLEGTVKSTKEMEKEISERKHNEKKKEKKLEKQKRKAEKAALKAAKEAKKKAKKEKKEKKEKKDKTKEAEQSKEETEPKEPQRKAKGIRATRNRYIAMKRQATADAKGLKEILMQ